MSHKKLVGEKLTFIKTYDWSAIYRGDELIHWHDSPDGEGLCSLLGIPYDVEELEEGIGPPNSLKEYRHLQRRKRFDDLTRQREELLARVSELDKQIEGEQ